MAYLLRHAILAKTAQAVIMQKEPVCRVPAHIRRPIANLWCLTEDERYGVPRMPSRMFLCLEKAS